MAVARGAENISWLVAGGYRGTKSRRFPALAQAVRSYLALLANAACDSVPLFYPVSLVFLLLLLAVPHTARAGLERVDTRGS